MKSKIVAILLVTVAAAGLIFVGYNSFGGSSKTIETTAASETRAQNQLMTAALTSGETLATGRFEGKNLHSTGGTVSIKKSANGYVLELGDDFDFDSAPDPRLAFGNNGFQQNTVFTVLKANDGKQIYEIPASIDPTGFNEVWLWCERFGISLGLAKLEKTAATTAMDKNENQLRGTNIGELAPDFELAKTDGAPVSLSDLQGKPAVLVFWTAWCPSCREEAPHINQLAADYAEKGVRVLGINIGEGDARVAQGIRDFGIKYPVARDADTRVAKTYKVVGTPTVIFLDKNGIVRYFGNELPEDYAARLDAISADS